jgi:hypothetical protein
MRMPNYDDTVRATVQALLQKKREERRKVAPSVAPRYDEVFFEGMSVFDAEKQMTPTYIFHRAEGWYPVNLDNDADALACVPLNPGTLRVERINDDGSTTEVYPLH